MTDKLILVLNCGSSSLKGAVLNNDNGDVLMTCLAEKMGLPDAYITFKVNGEKERVELAHAPNHTGAVEALLAELKKLGLYEKVGAIGHRVVSGGELYSDSVLITDEVIEALKNVSHSPLCTTLHTCSASTPRVNTSWACPMLPCLIPHSTKPCQNTPIFTPSHANITPIWACAVTAHTAPAIALLPKKPLALWAKTAAT